ncbi:hypothetical protein L1987_39103 [Smallanthus sonchifolius]|uniref:Uncharacterized protein n=1 Tax=Smallanthus sonchifolius TaxID=185202 RepID=A0ACB9HKW9_9ASTR|nr:hypothetical protein L1987_39103 [Smallanthus sonchifolius]
MVCFHLHNNIPKGRATIHSSQGQSWKFKIKKAHRMDVVWGEIFNFETPKVKRECCLCPFKGDALKPTNIDTLWVYVICSWLRPEVAFLSGEKMEPAIGLLRIQPDSFMKRCLICKQVHGSCIQCFKCATYFNVMCASRAGYCVEARRMDVVRGESVGVKGQLWLLLPILFVLQAFEAYVSVLLLQTGVFAFMSSNENESNALLLLRLIWGDIAKKCKKDIDDILRGPKDSIEQDDETVSGRAIQAIQLKKLIYEHLGKMDEETKDIIKPTMFLVDQALQLQNVISEHCMLKPR